MFKKLFVLSTLLFGLAFVGKVQADVSCQTIYGGGQTCVETDLAVDKKIHNPAKNSSTDSVALSEKSFVNGEIVTFEIFVTNNTGRDLAKVEVRDKFPDFVNFESGPGNFDQNTKTLTYVINNLKAGAQDKATVVGRVTEPTNITSGSVCVVNQATASAPNTQDGHDNVTFCIGKDGVTKGGLTVQAPPAIKETPPTGPEMLALFGLIPAGLSGILLRRKSVIKFGHRSVGGKK